MSYGNETTETGSVGHPSTAGIADHLFDDAWSIVALALAIVLPAVVLIIKIQRPRFRRTTGAAPPVKGSGADLDGLAAELATLRRAVEQENDRLNSKIEQGVANAAAMGRKLDAIYLTLADLADRLPVRSSRHDAMHRPSTDLAAEIADIVRELHGE